MSEVILQVFMHDSGQWGGRILRNGKEDGRVSGCNTQEDVEVAAAEAGIEFDQIEELDHIPPIN